MQLLIEGKASEICQEIIGMKFVVVFLQHRLLRVAVLVCHQFVRLSKGRLAPRLNSLSSLPL
jgi:hypothetical protein